MIRSGVNEDNELVNSETKNTDVDIGFVKPFGGMVVPPGYLYCDGSEVSRQAYDKLFAAIGTTWGEGDGENTFNLPDLRGIFIRCDGGENNAAIGVRQEDAIREITGAFNARRVSGSAMCIFEASGVFSDAIASSGSHGVMQQVAPEIPASIINFAASAVVPTAAEVRPVNVAMKYCIRYE